MRRILFVLCVAVLSGCASGEAVRTGRFYEATQASNIEILFEKPARPYEVVGQVTGKGRNCNSREGVFQVMREKAASIGADAILMNNSDMMVLKAATGLAIKYK